MPIMLGFKYTLPEHYNFSHCELHILEIPFFQANEQFMEKYNCTLPWMNSGKLELCPIRDYNRKQDFHELAKNWNSMLDRIKTCPIHPHCNRSIYRFSNLNT